MTINKEFTMETPVNGVSSATRRMQAAASHHRAEKIPNLMDIVVGQKPKMLVDDLLVWGSINTIYGDSGTQKSFLGYEIARAVATGTPVLGVFRVPEPVNVLFIQQDTYQEDFISNLQAMVRSMDKAEGPGIWEELHRRLSDTIKPWSHPQPGLNLNDNGKSLLRIIDTANALRTPFEAPTFHVHEESRVDQNGEVTTELIEQDDSGEHEGARLIIIDCLNNFIVGATSIDQDVITKFYVTLRELREKTNSTIVVIHHENRAGTIFGSSAITANNDAVFHVRGKFKEVRTVTVDKRRLVGLPSFKFWLEERDSTETEPCYRKLHFRGLIDSKTREDVKPSRAKGEGEMATEEQFSSYFKTRLEGMTVKDVETWAAMNGGVSLTTQRRWLNNVVTDGAAVKVAQETGDNRTKAYLYVPKRTIGEQPHA